MLTRPIEPIVGTEEPCIAFKDKYPCATCRTTVYQDSDFVKKARIAGYGEIGCIHCYIKGLENGGYTVPKNAHLLADAIDEERKEM